MLAGWDAESLHQFAKGGAGWAQHGDVVRSCQDGGKR